MTTRTPRASQTSIANSLPAGMLSFTQPPQTAAASYYKIAPSNPITFGWNFTYLIQTPTHLTVSAFCASNGNTYPVGPTDGVINGAATQVVWDAYQYEQQQGAVPLAQAEYTLYVHDERGPNSGIQAGLLSPNSGMKFSLYRPREYVPLESAYSPVTNLRLQRMLTPLSLRLELSRLLECNTSVFSSQDDANSCLPHLLSYVHQRLATASKTIRGQPLTAGSAYTYTASTPWDYCKVACPCRCFSLTDVRWTLHRYSSRPHTHALYTLLQFRIHSSP